MIFRLDCINSSGLLSMSCVPEMGENWLKTLNLKLFATGGCHLMELFSFNWGSLGLVLGGSDCSLFGLFDKFSL